MFEFFTSRAERRVRDRRAARMMLRDHGEDALPMLERRIEKTMGRDRAHWKRVYGEAVSQIAQTEKPTD